MSELIPMGSPSADQLIHPGYKGDDPLCREFRWLRQEHTRDTDEELTRYDQYLQYRLLLVSSELKLRGCGDFDQITMATNLREPAGFLFESDCVLTFECSEVFADGRLPLPDSPQELWAHHKYSVLARDPEWYRQIGPRLADDAEQIELLQFLTRCTAYLYQRPDQGRLRNAIRHIWGHLPDGRKKARARAEDRLVNEAERVRIWSADQRSGYLWTTTAVSDLEVWARIYATDSS